MKIQLLNTTSEIITITDGLNFSLIPGSYTEFDTKTSQLALSDQVVNNISNGNIVVNNFTKDLSPAEGARFLLTEQEPLFKDKDGKLFVYNTPKRPGFYVYWTGRGDDVTNNIVGKGESLLLHHKIGDPMTMAKYVDFHTIDNPTQMYEGIINWCKCVPGDSGSCSIVTSVMPTSPGTNTNFRLYNGYLIVPAAGDGDIEITGDITSTDPSAGCLVETDISEVGYKHPGFWNADYDELTNKFSNITPAPYGDGDYNMFAVEVPVVRFVNSAYLIDSGTQRLNSNDADTFNHGLRMKLEITTSDAMEDHEWSLSAILTLQREKTV